VNSNNETESIPSVRSKVYAPNAHTTREKGAVG
jgi:hypothetical protein